MKQGRLVVLLLVMGGLLAFRWFVPPRASTGVELPAPVARPPRVDSEPPAAIVARMVAESNRADAPVADSGDEVPGNAFAARLPPAPAPPVPPPRVPRTKRVAVVETPAPVVVADPLPPPAPPVRVIGTWNDGGVPAVFVAGPQGTLIARPGTVLWSEYQVTAVDSRSLSLIHLVSKYQWHIPVPVVSATP